MTNESSKEKKRAYMKNRRAERKAAGLPPERGKDTTSGLRVKRFRARRKAEKEQKNTKPINNNPVFYTDPQGYSYRKTVDGKSVEKFRQGEEDKAVDAYSISMPDPAPSPFVGFKPQVKPVMMANGREIDEFGRYKYPVDDNQHEGNEK